MAQPNTLCCTHCIAGLSMQTMSLGTVKFTNLKKMLLSLNSKIKETLIEMLHTNLFTNSSSLIF